MLKATNLVLRFLLELTALGALGYWGAQRHWTLAILMPLAMATFWGLVVAPKARYGGTRAVRLLLGLVVFFVAAAAIANTGHATLGWTFGAVTLVNTILTYAWGPQPGETSPET